MKGNNRPIADIGRRSVNTFAERRRSPQGVGNFIGVLACDLTAYLLGRSSHRGIGRMYFASAKCFGQTIMRLPFWI